jgi:hypothetical protein
MVDLTLCTHLHNYARWFRPLSILFYYFSIYFHSNEAIAARRVVAPASSQRFCGMWRVEKSPAGRRRHKGPALFANSKRCDSSITDVMRMSATYSEGEEQFLEETQFGSALNKRLPAQIRAASTKPNTNYE